MRLDEFIRIKAKKRPDIIDRLIAAEQEALRDELKRCNRHALSPRY